MSVSHRHNGRPARPISSFRASDVNLRPGEKPTLVCPDCHTWRFLAAGIIQPHRTGDGSRCAGSGQRVYRDVPLARLDDAERVEARQAATRRSARVHYKPAPPVPLPVHTPRVGRPEQYRGWAQRELSAQALRYANTALPHPEAA